MDGLCQVIILARILDVLSIPDGYFGIDEVLIILNKFVPFVVLWHCDWPSSQLFNSIVGTFCFASEDASICIVRFLDLPYNNRLEFPARCLQIQIRLKITMSDK